MAPKSQAYEQNNGGGAELTSQMKSNRGVGAELKSQTSKTADLDILEESDGGKNEENSEISNLVSEENFQYSRRAPTQRRSEI